MITTTPSTSPRRRGGFTLVELLVAMALIIFIMVILTEAFTAGTGVFRTLKSQGDMQERLRSATSLIRDDLRQKAGTQLHFANIDPLLSGLGAGAQPTQGYFHIQQPLSPVTSSGSVIEGTDGYNNPSMRMTSPFNNGALVGQGLPALAFTVHRNGNRQQDYYAARIPGAADYPGLPPFVTVAPAAQPSEYLLFSAGPADYQMPRPNADSTGLLLSQWAEVGYFLVPTGRSAGTDPNKLMPLYSLRRRLRVVLNNTSIARGLNTGTDANGNAVTRIPAGTAAQPIQWWQQRYAEVSCLPDTTGNILFNTPRDLVQPANVVLGPPVQALSAGQTMTVSQAGLAPMPGMDTFMQLNGPPSANGFTWAGDDLVLTDVVSFNVRTLAFDATGTWAANFPGFPTTSSGFLAGNGGQSAWQATDPVDFLDVAAANAVPIPAPQPGPGPNPQPPQMGMVPPGMAAPNPVFNTGSSPAPPYAVRALEITIRIWDVKTSLTRQVTIVQDM